MNSWKILLVFLAALVTASCSGASTPGPLQDGTSASSGSELRLSLQELAQQADLILLGRVEALESSWTEDRSAVFTEVRISPETWVKGDPQEHLVVRIPGGTVGEVTMFVAGAPDFILQERVILFLAEVDGNWELLEGSQGKLLIEGGRVWEDEGPGLPVKDFIQLIEAYL